VRYVTGECNFLSGHSCGQSHCDALSPYYQAAVSYDKGAPRIVAQHHRAVTRAVTVNSFVPFSSPFHRGAAAVTHKWPQVWSADAYWVTFSIHTVLFTGGLSFSARDRFFTSLHVDRGAVISAACQRLQPSPTAALSTGFFRNHQRPAAFLSTQSFSSNALSVT